MTAVVDNTHIHCTEITGVLGASRQEKKLPCAKCDWGHEPVTKVEIVSRAISKSHGFDPDSDAHNHGALGHFPIWKTYERDACAAIAAMEAFK